ncbi:MAG TPA: hypothetical protein VGN01_18430 [Acidobacteriaceae bacterium]
MLYLAVVTVLLCAILYCNHGIFTYTLDDPYIHLALAENLMHGHYGINPGEPSSPSSSIVWPFLLTPTAAAAWNQYLPLAWNVLFCGLAAWLLGRLADRWVAPRASWWTSFAVAASLMLVANLAGLTFVGMEHGLQVLLAIACAAGAMEALAGRPIPAWCLCAAALGPMVRYENFALVAALAVALWGQDRLGTPFRLIGASLAGPALFSLFLLSRGLPALPTSVLVKAKAYSVTHDGLLVVLHNMYWERDIGSMRQYAWWAQLVVAALLVYLAWHERQRPRRLVLTGALLAAMLQLAVGRVNWFNRYEVYALIFTTLVACTALFASKRVPRIALIAGLLAIGAPYALACWETPIAASNIVQQQYQMRRFVDDFYRQTVAVNDLGLVSYRRAPGVVILDLWGLASPEASRTPDKDADWLDTMTRTHSAGLAIVYPDWYEEGAPDDWDPLATMCITARHISVSRPCVVFYSTAVGDKARLAAEVAEFARTLPPSVRITLGRDTADREQ